MTTSSTKKFDYDLLVLGCGPAGQKAAFQSAKIRKKVAVVDKIGMVGGNCVHNATIPSKSFKEAVVYLSGFRQRNIYGAGYRVKTHIEMSDLTFRCNRIMQDEYEVLRAQFSRNHVDLLDGHGYFIDEHTIQITSPEGEITSKTAKNILISVGAKPVRPNYIEFDGVNIFDSDDILSMKELPRDITVVGGGVVGTEYASMFAALGVNVTVVDARKELLSFMDKEIVECLVYQMRSMGVTFRLGEEVESVKTREDNSVVTKLKSGKVVVSDVVLVSAGRISATENLGLENFGLELEPKGRIAVNEKFQTSLPHIYAAGDVIGFPALAATSSAQGRLVAVHAFDIDDEIMEVPLPIGMYSIPEISYVGANEQELTEQNIPYETGIARFKEIARGVIIGDEEGMLKILFHRETYEILGVHIIGEYATELSHIGQAVIALKGGLRYLRDAVFNYPTLAEAYKVAAFDGYNKAKASLALKKK